MKAWARTQPDRGYRLCPTCEGRGWCEHCDGTGRALFDKTTRCFWCAARGECPICEGAGQLPDDHDAFRDAERPQIEAQVVSISTDQAIAHGLSPLSIRVNADAAGLSARPFPMKGMYVALNGPPGGAIVVSIGDCSDVDADIASVIRAKVTPPWASSLELGLPDQANLLGATRHGMTFATGSDVARIGWFGFVLEHDAGRALVTAGISWRSSAPLSAADVVAHPSIAKAFETLELKSTGSRHR